MVSAKPQVLIVDDEPVVCNLLNADLSDRGYLCATAFDGREALTKMEKQDYDVVLLDIRLPGMSGMEVLQRIRSDHPNMVTIMISGINSADSMVEALRLGAWAYITKPFNVDEVSGNIDTILEARKSSPERRGSKTPRPGGEEVDKPATEELLSEMDAIALGVEAKVDILTGYSQLVTERTADIARQLDIPEAEIKGWIAARTTLDAEKRRAIGLLAEPAKRSILAESVVSITKLLLSKSELGESRN